MFKSQVFASYQIVEIDAGLADKLKGLAKKATKAFLPVFLTMFGASIAHGKPLTPDQAKKLDHLVQTTLQTNHIENIKFSTKIVDKGGSSQIQFTYFAADGSKAGINLVQTKNGNFTFHDLGETKNKEGYVDPTVKELATDLYKTIQTHLEK